MDSIADYINLAKIELFLPNYRSRKIRLSDLGYMNETDGDLAYAPIVHSHDTAYLKLDQSVPQTVLGEINITGDDVPQLTVGRDTDGQVGILLERRYIGKYDWLIKNAGHLEIYGDDGAGTVPTTLRMRINDTGSVDMFAGASIWGNLGVVGDTATKGLILEDGETGDSWYWIGTDSDGEGDDDDPLMIGKGNVVGVDPYITISPDGNVDFTGTITSGHLYPNAAFKNLGADDNKWYHIYIGGSAYLNNAQISGSDSIIGMSITNTQATDAMGRILFTNGLGDDAWIGFMSEGMNLWTYNPDILYIDGNGHVHFSGDTVYGIGKLGIIEGGASPTKYTYFQGGNQSDDLTYTLPIAYPAANSLPLISSAVGVMGWSTNFGANDIITTGTISGVNVTSGTDPGHTHTTYEASGAVATHAGLPDPHTGYRLESADHSHQSAGAQAGKLDHGLALDGLGDDDHTQYIKHSLATAISDFLVASGVGVFVKKTLAEVKTILGLGTAAYTAATDYVTHALATAANDFLVASGVGTYVKKTLAETKVILGVGAAPQGFLINGKLSVTVASNNLTVAIKTLAGTDPSATDPVYIRINDTVRTITSALSVTKNAGTNWCNAGSAELATKEIDYFVYLGYNATDGVVIGFSRKPWGTRYGDFSTTSTNEGYCAISTITNAVAGDYYELIGRFAATLSAGAGYTWTVPTFTAVNLINRPIYETRYLSWQPVYTCAGAMTFTETSVIVLQYKIIGRTLNACLYVYGTTGGVADVYIQASSPMSLNLGIGTCYIYDTTFLGFVSINGNFFLFRYDMSNWSLNTDRVISAMGNYQLA